MNEENSNTEMRNVTSVRTFEVGMTRYGDTRLMTIQFNGGETFALGPKTGTDLYHGLQVAYLAICRDEMAEELLKR